MCYQAIQTICQAAESRETFQTGPHLVIAVCGVKGMGKSSMTRLLANRLLNCCEVMRGHDVSVSVIVPVLAVPSTFGSVPFWTAARQILL